METEQNKTKQSLCKQHKKGKAGKGYENRPIIDYLNKSFQVVFSKELGHSFDRDIIKFR